MSGAYRAEAERVASLALPWEKLKNKKILISGGTGLLGSFFIEVARRRNELGDGIGIVSLSRRTRESDGTVTYLSHDITRPLEISFKPDFILHLASNTHPEQYRSDPVGTITTNIFGCYHLLETARRWGSERFLLASSVEIYGDGKGTPMNEQFCGDLDCNTARAGYNESKRLSESLCQSYRAQYGTDCVIARLSRCFGYDEKADSKALAQFLAKAVAGEDILLKSAGRQAFSYCYVVDAVAALYTILLNGESGEAYNVAEEDEGLTLGDYARLIASFAGRKVVFDFDPSKNQGVSAANYAILDFGKLKAIGYRPLYTVSEALRETYLKYKNLG